MSVNIVLGKSEYNPFSGVFDGMTLLDGETVYTLHGEMHGWTARNDQGTAHSVIKEMDSALALGIYINQRRFK